MDLDWLRLALVLLSVTAVFGGISDVVHVDSGALDPEFDCGSVVKPCSNITHAIINVNEGGSIIIKPGIYRECLDVPFSVNFTSSEEGSRFSIECLNDTYSRPSVNAICRNGSCLGVSFSWLEIKDSFSRDGLIVADYGSIVVNNSKFENISATSLSIDSFSTVVVVLTTFSGEGTVGDDVRFLDLRLKPSMFQHDISIRSCIFNNLDSTGIAVSVLVHSTSASNTSLPVTASFEESAFQDNIYGPSLVHLQMSGTIDALAWNMYGCNFTNNRLNNTLKSVVGSGLISVYTESDAFVAAGISFEFDRMVMEHNSGRTILLCDGVLSEVRVHMQNIEYGYNTHGILVFARSIFNGSFALIDSNFYDNSLISVNCGLFDGFLSGFVQQLRPIQEDFEYEFVAQVSNVHFRDCTTAVAMPNPSFIAFDGGNMSISYPHFGTPLFGVLSFAMTTEFGIDAATDDFIFNSCNISKFWDVKSYSWGSSSKFFDSFDETGQMQRRFANDREANLKRTSPYRSRMHDHHQHQIRWGNDGDFNFNDQERVPSNSVPNGFRKKKYSFAHPNSDPNSNNDHVKSMLRASAVDRPVLNNGRGDCRNGCPPINSLSIRIDNLSIQDCESDNLLLFQNNVADNFTFRMDDSEIRNCVVGTSNGLTIDSQANARFVVWNDFSLHRVTFSNIQSEWGNAISLFSVGGMSSLDGPLRRASLSTLTMVNEVSVTNCTYMNIVTYDIESETIGKSALSPITIVSAYVDGGLYYSRDSYYSSGNVFKDICCSGSHLILLPVSNGNVRIENSYFERISTSPGGGGIVRFSSMATTIYETIIRIKSMDYRTGRNIGDGGAVSIDIHGAFADIEISDISVNGSEMFGKGGVVYAKFLFYSGRFAIINLDSFDTSATSGGVIYASISAWAKQSLIIMDFLLENVSIMWSEVHESGGAIYFSGTANIRIVNCQFVHTWVKFMGGALAMEGTYTLLIANSTFEKNEAHIASVAYLESIRSEWIPVVGSITFVGNVWNVYEPSFTGATLESTTSSRYTIFLSESLFKGYELDTFVCPTGSIFSSREVNITADDFYDDSDFGSSDSQNDIIESKSINCEKCQVGEYFLGDATSEPGNTGQCRKCEKSSVCYGGAEISPYLNHWIGRDVMTYTSYSCPNGFCCSNADRCSNESTRCAEGREGFLCGNCEMGYCHSLDISKCVRCENCGGAAWFIIRSLLLAVLYVSIIMVLPQSSTGTFKVITYFFQILPLISEPPSLGDTFKAKVRSLFSFISLSSNLQLVRDSSAPACPFRNLSSGGVIAMELIGPLLFFSVFFAIFCVHFPPSIQIQMILTLFKILKRTVLFAVWTILKVKSGTNESFEKWGTAILNRQFSDTISKSISNDVVEVIGLTDGSEVEVEVELADMTEMDDITSEDGNSENENGASTDEDNERQEEAPLRRPPLPIDLSIWNYRWRWSGRYAFTFMSLVLLAYRSVAAVSISLLACKRFRIDGHFEWRVFTAPSLECMKNGYQSLLLLFTLFGVLPFPFYLLVFRWIVNVYYYRVPKKNWDHILRANMVVLESPFRSNAKYWESVLMFRRLIIVIFWALIPSAYSRQVVLAITCQVILLTHIVVQPFQDMWVERMETMSLFLLGILSILTVRNGVVDTEGVDDGSFSSAVEFIYYFELFACLLVVFATFSLVLLTFLNVNLTMSVKTWWFALTSGRYLNKLRFKLGLFVGDGNNCAVDEEGEELDGGSSECDEDAEAEH